MFQVKWTLLFEHLFFVHFFFFLLTCVSTILPRPKTVTLLNISKFEPFWSDTNPEQNYFVTIFGYIVHHRLYLCIGEEYFLPSKVLIKEKYYQGQRLYHFKVFKVVLNNFVMVIWSICHKTCNNVILGTRFLTTETILWIQIQNLNFQKLRSKCYICSYFLWKYVSRLDYFSSFMLTMRRVKWTNSRV